MIETDHPRSGVNSDCRPGLPGAMGKRQVSDPLNGYFVCLPERVVD